MEVKIFSKTLKCKTKFLSNDETIKDNGLEAEINLWLAANANKEIIEINQTQSGGSLEPATLVISIWYR